MRTSIRLLVLALVVLAAAAYRDAPVEAAGAGIIALSAGGFHTCALSDTGAVFCWGDDGVGQLGDAGQCHPSCDRPTIVADLGGRVTAIAAGNGHQCAAITSGGVMCWGSNYAANLGDETHGRCLGVDCSLVAVTARGLSGTVESIATGNSHTCALTSRNIVMCWGSNERGQLGNGTTTGTSGNWTPVSVVGLSSTVRSLSAGGEHTCALVDAGSGSGGYAATCWGDNEFGQLGNGSGRDDRPNFSTVPVEVLNEDGTPEADFVALDVGYKHTCAITTAGAATCWGSNQNGQLGSGGLCGDGNRDYFCSVPVVVTGLSSGVSAISASFAHTCALTDAGAVKCWGRNSSGQLGDGHGGHNSTAEEEDAPIDVVGLDHGVSAISAGQLHTCALLTPRSVKCWGDNGEGQIGDGTKWDHSTPEGLHRPSPVTVVGLLPDIIGSADCNVAVDSIDAAFLLQFTARLVPTLSCALNGDANQDARIDSLDTLLILQYVAGLIAHLPA